MKVLKSAFAAVAVLAATSAADAQSANVRAGANSKVSIQQYVTMQPPLGEYFAAEVMKELLGSVHARQQQSYSNDGFANVCRDGYGGRRLRISEEFYPGERCRLGRGWGTATRS